MGRDSECIAFQPCITFRTETVELKFYLLKTDVAAQVFVLSESRDLFLNRFISSLITICPVELVPFQRLMSFEAIVDSLKQFTYSVSRDKHSGRPVRCITRRSFMEPTLTS